jgi:hypothetical protein
LCVSILFDTPKWMPTISGRGTGRVRMFPYSSGHFAM